MMFMNKICPVCNHFFTAKRNNQVYCSCYCRKKHHKQTYYSKNRIVENLSEKLNGDNEAHIIRQFKCKKCQKLVTIVNKEDRRTVFCSPRCEKLYWKHSKKVIKAVV